VASAFGHCKPDQVRLLCGDRILKSADLIADFGTQGITITAFREPDVKDHELEASFDLLYGLSNACWGKSLTAEKARQRLQKLFPDMPEDEISFFTASFPAGVGLTFPDFRLIMGREEFYDLRLVLLSELRL